MANTLGIKLTVPDESIRAMSEKFSHSYGMSVSDRTYIDGQILCAVEEVGEFAAAYRRWSGRARRTGTLDDVYKEYADALISMIHAGWLLGINDPQEVLDQKIGHIMERPTRDRSATPRTHPFKNGGTGCCATCEDPLGVGEHA